MTNSGDKLEAIVASVEEIMLPHGFVITKNDRVFDDDGNQTAEFDIQIRGRLGTTDIAWLIECRDRPSQGAAPVSWIEQLAGRRQRFNFSKVTAVSTTGFSKAAEEYAAQTGIELRELNSLEPDQLAEWLPEVPMESHVRLHKLLHAAVDIDPEICDELKQAVEELVKDFNLEQPLLRSTQDQAIITLASAFQAAAEGLPQIYEGLEPCQPGKRIRIQANYTDDESHFVIDTAIGSARVRQIDFIGELSVVVDQVPAQISQYDRVGTDDPIAQIATFPLKAGDLSVAVDMYRLEDTGTIQITARKTAN